MEKFFCGTKKILIVLLLVFMATILIAPKTQAIDYISSVSKGERYQYTGLAMLVFKTESAAKNGNIFRISCALRRGDIITVKEKKGNIIKIDENKYIKLTDSNKGKFQQVIIPATSLSLNKTKLKLELEGVRSERLIPTVTPNNTTYKHVIWTSSNTDVARVGRDGTVIAVGVGKAIITAKMERYQNRIVTCEVEVVSYKYNFGKDTYKIAVTSSRLDKVLNIIEENGLFQNDTTGWNSALRKHCDEVSNYHIFLLKGIKSVVNDSGYTKEIKGYTRENLLSIGNVYGTMVGKNTEKATLKQLKNNIDKGKPTKVYVTWTGEHWVTAVGYKGNGEKLTDFLFISTWNGNLIQGGTGEAGKLSKETNNSYIYGLRIYN